MAPRPSEPCETPEAITLETEKHLDCVCRLRDYLVELEVLQLSARGGMLYCKPGIA